MDVPDRDDAKKRRKSARDSNNFSSTRRRVPPGGAPAPDGAPSRTAARSGDAPSRRQGEKPSEKRELTVEERQLIDREKRIEELRRQEENARAERLRLQQLTVAQSPPTVGTEEFVRQRGFVYATWFKARGARELGATGNYERMKELLNEGISFDVPSAFFSSSITAQVKWLGIRDREELIRELNETASWSNDGYQDFRDIYPEWEYYYQITESIGTVVVRIYEYKAHQPFESKDRRKGFHSR
jgi:hypothetical protein